MIEAYTIEALDRALAKARVKMAKVKPSIIIREFGLYEVSRSNEQGWYKVRAGRTEDGKLFIACECRGGLEGRACYHAAKVFETHTAFAKRIKSHDLSLPSKGQVTGTER